MRRNWLEHVLETVADRGRELLKLQTAAKEQNELAALCAALVADRGQASTLALSREILRAYQNLSLEQKCDFFELLHRDYGPDPQAIQSASEAYERTQTLDHFLQLSAAVEPPRQELFRRLNMVAYGTASLVAMRGDLLHVLKQRPHLKAVDTDLQHLLASWFNPGFLRLKRIDWHSPAHVLEKLVNYESVHEIKDWNALRRRLVNDRRCYAFFHPAMPDEPLIFVEVALTQGMAAHVQPLLDATTPELSPGEADTAMFYSINNTQFGLRGISFGNFLIKQVLTELREELPGLKHFATISPLPGFADMVRGDRPGLDRAMLDALLDDFAAFHPWDDETTASSPSEILFALLQDDATAHRDILAEPLERLALAYLTLPGKNGVVDPVASFHLSNGASLEQINPFADNSAHRMQASFGVMVNYLYEPNKIEKNHESFVAKGKIAMSKHLSKIVKQIESAKAATEVTSEV